MAASVSAVAYRVPGGEVEGEMNWDALETMSWPEILLLAGVVLGGVLYVLWWVLFGLMVLVLPIVFFIWLFRRFPASRRKSGGGSQGQRGNRGDRDF